MKKIAKIGYLLLAIIAIKGCVEPIEIKGIETDNFLIIEATLTDELKTQRVKLTRTFSLDSIESIKETNAVVKINSDATSYSFTETSDGIYTSDIQFKATPNTVYTLEVNTQDGKKYLSRPEKLIGSSTITEITAKVETNNLNEEGVRFYLKGKGLDEDSKYFRYEFEETYRVIAPFWEGQELEIVNDERPDFEVRLIPNLNNNRICYQTVNSNQIIQKETATLIGGEVDSDIFFLDKFDFKISNRYSVLIKQHVQSFEAYNYFKTLNKLASSGGSFTQTQPGFLLGNITSTSNSNDKAIGYFEVATVTSKRIFLNREDLWERDPVNFIDECGFIAPELIVIPRVGIEFAWSPLIQTLERNDWMFHKMNPEATEILPGEYILVPRVCGDCTVSGSNVRPNFWID